MKRLVYMRTNQILYDDDIAALLKEIGSLSIDRASIVETFKDLPKDVQERIGKADPTEWWVSFKPIHDDTILGPFVSREKALEEEKAYMLRQL